MGMLMGRFSKTTRIAEVQKIYAEHLVFFIYGLIIFSDNNFVRQRQKSKRHQLENETWRMDGGKIFLYIIELVFLLDCVIINCVGLYFES